MLHEVHAEALRYDEATDTLHLTAPGAAGTGRRALLDAKGFLVGVDLRDEAGRGAVVMLGPHEAVTETREAFVTVRGDEVLLAHARGAARGAEKSPYL